MKGLSFSAIIAATTMNAKAVYEFDENSPIIQQLRKSPFQPLKRLSDARDAHPDSKIGSLGKMRELADTVANELRVLCAQPSVTLEDHQIIGKHWLNQYCKIVLQGIMANRSFTPVSREVYDSLGFAIAFLGDDIQSID